MPPGVGDYLTVDTMRQLALDAGYLTTSEAQRLAKPDGEMLACCSLLRG
jgi:hypothetical protein